ncbi:MAG: hypothetical protein A2133_09045 [Actinobacteria bacterium RBG_16_64_13]|nr:MAG: hypothetical protein A2133_09045 [Actinobacteria bacterium RBG_16_64_13]
MEWDAGAIMRIAIGAFFVLFGVGVAFALFRLASVFKRLSNILRDANTQVIPLLTRIGSTLDGVNAELDKVEQITGSVAEIVKTAEQTTTALHSAVAKPIRKVAGMAAGISAGVSSFITRIRKES